MNTSSQSITIKLQNEMGSAVDMMKSNKIKRENLIEVSWLICVERCGNSRESFMTGDYFLKNTFENEISVTSKRFFEFFLSESFKTAFYFFQILSKSSNGQNYFKFSKIFPGSFPSHLCLELPKKINKIAHDVRGL